MRRRQEDYIIIILALILVIIIFGIVYMLLFQPPQQPSKQNLVIPTAYPTQEEAPSPTQEVSPDEAGSAPPHEDIVTFDHQAEIKLLDRLKNRRALSETDSFAKATILTFLPSGESSGIVYQTSTILVEYIEPVDEFQVTIFTTNILQAKTEANLWFRIHGVSQQGICDLPLNFLPGAGLIDYLRETRTIFNSLPNECQ